MKRHTKIAWILALALTSILFGVTFSQIPATFPFLERFALSAISSAVVGVIVFFITYGIGSFIVWLKKLIKQ